VTMRFQVSGWTDRGRVRPTNADAWSRYVPADSYRLATKGAFFAVADGLDGRKAGDFASRRAIETTMHTYYRDPSPDPAGSLARAIQMANFDLRNLGYSFPAYASLRTTLVAAVVRDTEAVVANVGDSRAYLVRGLHTWQITHDHSWVAEFGAGVLSPAEMRRHPWRKVITRALGLGEDVRVDLFRVALQPGDTLVLCSDGLTDLVNDHEIGRVVRQTPLAQVPQVLVDRANRLGGDDNITAMVTRVWPAVPYPLAYPTYGPPMPAYRPSIAVVPSEPAWVPLVELTGGLAGTAGVITLIMSLVAL
jgi:serine/threonine protein phosphatase PrpC